MTSPLSPRPLSARADHLVDGVGTARVMIIWGAVLSLAVPWLESQLGQELPDSAVVAAGLGAVGLLVGGRPRGLMRLGNGIVAIFLLLVGWYLFRLSGVADPDRGWERVEPLLTSGVLVGLVCAAWAQPVKRVAAARWLEYAGIGSFLLVVVLAADLTSGRLQVAGINSIWVGRFAMLLGLCVLLGGRLRRWARWGAFAAALVIAVFSGSRGPALAGLLALMIAGLAQFRAARGRRLLAGSLVATVLAGLVLALILFIQVVPISTALPGPVARFGAILSLDAEGLAGEESFTERMYMQGIAADAFEEAPVTGRGPGHLWISSTFRYPHNLPLEIAAEAGLVGLFLFGLMVALALRASRHDLWLLASLVLALFGSFLSGDIGGNAMVFWLCLVAGARGNWQRLWSRRARRLNSHAPAIVP